MWELSGILFSACSLLGSGHDASFLDAPIHAAYAQVCNMISTGFSACSMVLRITQRDGFEINSGAPAAGTSASVA